MITTLLGSVLLASAFGCGAGGGGPPVGQDPVDGGTSVDTAGPSDAPPADSRSGEGAASTALERVVASVGDKAALAALGSLVVAATGTSAAYDEGPMPADMPFLSSDFKITTSLDLAGNRLKLAHESTYKLIRPGRVAKYDAIIRDNVGFIVGDERVTGGVMDYTAKMSSARLASTRRQQWMLHPHLLLKRLAAAEVTESGTADWKGKPQVKFMVKDPDKVSDLELLVDQGTGRLSALATKESDHLRGDVVVRVVYEAWQAKDALFFPGKVVVEVEGHPVRSEDRTVITVNPTLADALFMFPAVDPHVHDEAEAVRGAKHGQSYQRFCAMGVAPSQEFPHNTVRAIELGGAGSGLYHLIGSTHHSLLVDQGKTVVLVDAPNDAARARAILDWIDKTLPGGAAENKVSHVILTHHHVDHSSGLRTFVARGAIPVVGEESKALWSKVLAAPRTIDPDELVGKATPAATLVTVALGKSFTLGNVTAHHVTNRHSADTLVIHVTSAGTPPVLFVSDIYIPSLTSILPSSGFVLWSKDLDDALVGLKLDTPNLAIVGGHGNVDAMGMHFTVPYSSFKAQLTTAMAMTTP